MERTVSHWFSKVFFKSVSQTGLSRFSRLSLRENYLIAFLK